MIIHLGDRKYHITWQHVMPNAPHSMGWTTCYIHELLPNGIHRALVQADARCSGKDNYSKNTGRKISLERALLTKVPDWNGSGKWIPLFMKDERKAVWNEYFRMRGNKF
jgi:hypothetical protein